MEGANGEPARSLIYPITPQNGTNLFHLIGGSSSAFQNCGYFRCIRWHVNQRPDYIGYTKDGQNF